MELKTYKLAKKPDETSLTPAAIGIFDSGIGGLSVLQHVHNVLPAHPIIYVADQAHVPYGTRSLEEVRALSFEITRFLLGKNTRIIVVACNTASAAALHSLREHFLSVPFVGMEPAVKPAANQTRSGVVGVLATPATFQGELFASVVNRFAKDIIILQSTCPGLVEEIEKGDAAGERAQKILQEALKPMLAHGVDAIVLGCTHYPFAIQQIRELIGPDVDVIDPSPAIARQTRRVLEQNGWLLPGKIPAQVSVYTSGSVQKLQKLLPDLLGESYPVQAIRWKENILVETASIE